MEVEWDDVRHLEAIERTGSVKAAARALGVSASTVYRRIAALEAATGQPCIVRGAGDGMLTDFGAAVARVGRQTRVGLAEAIGAARALDPTLAGEVSLTTVEALLPFVLQPIAEITATHPLQVVLHLGDDGPSVRDREVDLAISVVRRPPPGCWGRRLCRLPYGVFGTRAAIGGLPAPRWVTRTLTERHSAEFAWEREHVTGIAARARFSALVEMVAAGIGLGLMPRLLAERHPELVEVPQYRPLVEGLERPVWLLVHPDQRRNPRVAAVMTALQRGFDPQLRARDGLDPS